MTDVPIELQLDLPSFEGPLDLLLQLVREQEVDIVDISIAAITRDYLTCVERMDELDLDVGGEWLEMAARLMHMKSRTLLPDDQDEDQQGDSDPRDALIERLITYERFKRYADKLGDRNQLGCDVFTPPSQLDTYRDEVGPPDIRDEQLGTLVDAIERVLEETAETPTVTYEMEHERLSLQSVMLEVAEQLQSDRVIRFESLFGSSPRRHRIVTTFFALLEMARLEMIQLPATSSPSGPLRIRRLRGDLVTVTRDLELEAPI